MQVQNRYLRQVSDDKNGVLEKLAQEADEKRERGELMGPPPSPIPAAKRRYDPTSPGPSTNAQRSLAPDGEAPSLELHRPTIRKRSHLMDILNDEPVEFSPPLKHHRDEASSLQPTTASRYPLEPSSINGRQESFPPQASHQMQDNISSYSASQIRDWLSRFDPRLQYQALPQYSVHPPSTQSHQINPPQSSLSQSQHRTILGRTLQHSSHVSSSFDEVQNLSLPKTETSHPVEPASGGAHLIELHVDESG